MQHQLDFKHICFQYPNSQASLFKELNFSVKTGELVGILGSSGSGKTTLTEILLALLYRQLLSGATFPSKIY